MEASINCTFFRILSHCMYVHIYIISSIFAKFVPHKMIFFTVILPAGAALVIAFEWCRSGSGSNGIGGRGNSFLCFLLF